MFTAGINQELFPSELLTHSETELVYIGFTWHFNLSFHFVINFYVVSPFNCDSFFNRSALSKLECSGIKVLSILEMEFTKFTAIVGVDNWVDLPDRRMMLMDVLAQWTRHGSRCPPTWRSLLEMFKKLRLDIVMPSCDVEEYLLNSSGKVVCMHLVPLSTLKYVRFMCMSSPMPLFIKGAEYRVHLPMVYTPTDTCHNYYREHVKTWGQSHAHTTHMAYDDRQIH